MSSKKLQNYLRTHRKRFGLSQSDVAFLLGGKSANKGKVSRYERFAALPSLKTALMYEAVFEVPVAQLFAGVYKQVERETSKRARALQNNLLNTKPTRRTKRKADLLRAIEVTPDMVKENP